MTTIKPLRLLMLAALALGLGACTKSNYTVYALTNTGALISFTADKPATLINDFTLSGMPSGQSIVQIDYQPSSGVLLGLTSGNQLCQIAPSSGAVSACTTTPFISDVTLVDTVAAVDSVTGLLRVISSSENVQVDPVTGLIDVNGTQVAFDNSDTHSGVAPQLAALAYSTHYKGATSTTLYALDVKTQSLLRVGDPSATTTTSVDAGVLHTIGTTGVSFSYAAMNIEAKNGDAYAALQPNGAGASLYQIDLPSGAASKVDAIGDGDRTIISLAITPDR